MSKVGLTAMNNDEYSLWKELFAAWGLEKEQRFIEQKVYFVHLLGIDWFRYPRLNVVKLPHGYIGDTYRYPIPVEFTCGSIDCPESIPSHFIEISLQEHEMQDGIWQYGYDEENNILIMSEYPMRRWHHA